MRRETRGVAAATLFLPPSLSLSLSLFLYRVSSPNNVRRRGASRRYYPPPFIYRGSSLKKRSFGVAGLWLPAEEGKKKRAQSAFESARRPIASRDFRDRRTIAAVFFSSSSSSSFNSRIIVAVSDCYASPLPFLDPDQGYTDRFYVVAMTMRQTTREGKLIDERERKESFFLFFLSLRTLFPLC